MRKSAIALSLLLILGASVAFTACGSDSSSTTTETKTVTVPDGKLGATAVPVELGYYAGMSCDDRSCGYFNAKAQEFAKRACHGGKPAVDQPNSFKYYNSKEKYITGYAVCFTREERGVKNFYFNKRLIVNSIHSDADRFPETCDNGNCIQGEWSNAEDVHGKIRSPTNVYTYYDATYDGS